MSYHHPLDPTPTNHIMRAVSEGDYFVFMKYLSQFTPYQVILHHGLPSYFSKDESLLYDSFYYAKNTRICAELARIAKYHGIPLEIYPAQEYKDPIPFRFVQKLVDEFNYPLITLIKLFLYIYGIEPFYILRNNQGKSVIDEINSRAWVKLQEYRDMDKDIKDSASPISLESYIKNVWGKVQAINQLKMNAQRLAGQRAYAQAANLYEQAAIQILGLYEPNNAPEIKPFYEEEVLDIAIEGVKILEIEIHCTINPSDKMKKQNELVMYIGNILSKIHCLDHRQDKRVLWFDQKISQWQVHFLPIVPTKKTEKGFFSSIASWMRPAETHSEDSGSEHSPLIPRKEKLD